MNGDGNNKHDNDFVRAADILVHFAAVAFSYIEEYSPPPPLDKTVVWTPIYRYVFDDNENALVWTGPKGMEISKILG